MLLLGLRREVLAAAALAAWPGRSAAAPRVDGFTPRVEGIGGGADLLTGRPSVPDVLFPPSLLGYWRCERAVTLVEGDAAQAAGAWFDLGGDLDGGGDFRKAPEAFYTRFVPSPTGGVTDGGVGVVLDRGFEVDARVHGAASVSWDVRAPGTLTYERRAGGGGIGGPVELAVVERRVEPPSDVGFGFNELVRVTGSAGGLFGGAQLVKAARVQRRYRRAYDAAGERVVEGLEVMRTYRVLDGVAGVELPTSTTKSTLRLSRPTVAQLKADGVEAWGAGGA